MYQDLMNFLERCEHDITIEMSKQDWYTLDQDLKNYAAYTIIDLDAVNSGVDKRDLKVGTFQRIVNRYGRTVNIKIIQ